MIRAQVVLREGWELTFARPLLSAILVLSTTLAISIPAVLELFSLRAAAMAQVADFEHGAHIYVVSDEEGGSISGGECNDIQSWSGVERVSWLGEESTINFAESPRNPFRAMKAGSELPRMIDPTLSESTGSVHIGAAAASELGVEPGGTLSVGGGALVFDSVLAEGYRAPDQARWIYIIEPAPSSIRECWVETRPGAEDIVFSALRSGFTASPSLQVEALSLPLLEDALASWSVRIQQYSWIACGLLGALPAVILLLTRRHEFAVYLLAGFSRAETALIFTVNTVILAFGAAWVAAGLATLGAIVLVPVWAATATVISLASVVGATAVATGLVGLFTSWLSARNASSAIKERG